MMDSSTSEISTTILKKLHLLTRDGRLNSDAARKIKQIKHLVQFLEPFLSTIFEQEADPVIVDFGSGKSYLGFFLYDLFVRHYGKGRVISVEARQELIEKSVELALESGFERMEFIHSTIEESWSLVPEKVHIVTALHACDTATDDVLSLGVKKGVPYIVYVPCCQAELARKIRYEEIDPSYKPLVRHPHHRREWGALITNIMRGLWVESKGYKVRVSELVGWEHALKNEIWLAEKHQNTNKKAAAELELLVNHLKTAPKCCETKEIF
jgi:hypothetical protein